MKIETVSVIGANGTMGRNVSAIFASFGNAKVYMICRNIDEAKKARDRAKMSVKAEVIEENLIAKCYTDLAECISDSDLVFESVSEDINIKKEVYKKIKGYINKNAIIVTGTSGISINKLSECFESEMRARYFGMHMYNPPYSMTLCEVIPSEYTNREMVNEAKRYLENKLQRNVVEVKDRPAFMGNRIGFQFINEAMQFAERYKDNGGIDYIDGILGPFSGRTMSPLETSDFVGLDVHKAIADNIYMNTNDYAHDTFRMPEFALKLIEEHKLGRKSGCGLYQIIIETNGEKIVKVYDIMTGKYRDKEKYNFSFSKHMINEFRVGNYKKAISNLINNHSIEAKICLSFLIKYVIYSIYVAKTVGETVYAADDAMANGFGWIPPLAVLDALGGRETFSKIAIDILEDRYLGDINLEYILNDVPSSKYDYRPFFKGERIIA